MVTILHNTELDQVHSCNESVGRTRHLYAVPERRVPRASYVPAGRTLHLIDVENLMGGPRVGEEALHLACEAYRSSVVIAHGDHVIAASNPGLGLLVKLEWPAAQVLVRGGPDGADLVLLESVSDVRWTAARYDRIMIGSGDGAFEAVASVFGMAGIAVGVVSREESLSRDLAAAATFVRIIEEPATAEVVA